MTAVSNGVLLYATDPDPTAAEIVFDFIGGQVLLAVALDAPVPITGTTARTLDPATSTASGASGAAGTLTQTLGLSVVAAGVSGAAGSLTQTLANTTGAASGASGGAGTLTVTLADSTVAAAGTFTDSTPPPGGGSSTKRRRLRLPRFSGGGHVGRNVHITATADLGRLTAQTSPRVELADEELIELL